VIEAAVGGVLIGLAAVWLFASLGRVAGISGIVGQIIEQPISIDWRVLFIVGLGLGGWLGAALAGGPMVRIPDPAGWVMLAAGGVLVGFGTRLGSGCTSGHGVCGMARLSVRSIVATLTFVAVGMLTATAIH
jgi:uncharacterized membrane protein YedE/YeeE